MKILLYILGQRAAHFEYMSICRNLEDIHFQNTIVDYIFAGFILSGIFSKGFNFLILFYDFSRPFRIPWLFQVFRTPDHPVFSIFKTVYLLTLNRFFETGLPGDKILVAHNCKTFDAPMLTREISKENLWERFSKAATGFSDTLPIFKARFPGRKSEKKTYKQEDLARDILGEEAENAHNAIADVEILHKLVEKVDISAEEFIQTGQSVRSVYEADAIAARRHSIKVRLQYLKTSFLKVGLTIVLVGMRKRFFLSIEMYFFPRYD